MIVNNTIANSMIVTNFLFHFFSFCFGFFKNHQFHRFQRVFHEMNEESNVCVKQMNRMQLCKNSNIFAKEIEITFTNLTFANNNNNNSNMQYN